MLMKKSSTKIRIKINKLKKEAMKSGKMKKMGI